MEFKEFKDLFQKNFEIVTMNIDYLFEAEVDRESLWERYLNSFPKGTNEIYREKREFDCSECRQFIKQFGNVVILKNGTIKSIWDFEVSDPKYQAVTKALDNYIKNQVISNVKITNERKIGTNRNYEKKDDGTIREWHHFYLELPDKFVYHGNKSVDSVKGDYRATKEVFKRSLDELTHESIITVLELIYQNSLYKGEEWKGVLEEFKKYKESYDKLPDENQKDIFSWENSIKAGPVISRIKNHSIGTLLLNITERMELDLAVKKYETIVAPSNYKRPKPIFTKRMLEDAKKTVEELGYLDSLNRRFATLDDITVNNILFSNKDSAKRIHGNVFDEMEKEVSINPKKFSRVEEISITNFLNNVLPNTKQIEVFLENKHTKNMVSLISPINKDSETMFKWNNGFSWAYTGNITDSSMKENVKMAGGNIEGVLRFSIQWNDGYDWDKNDLDAHCIEPRGNEIHFRNMNNIRTSGMLDVDIIDPKQGKPAVENITWTNTEKMEEGTYKFFVHNYSHRGGRNGFKAEIEFDGQIFEFEYSKELRQGENIPVADVTLKNGIFSIKEQIPSQLSNKDIWNMKTNQFIPVSVVMYSPNYWDDWDEQEGIGHKHVFFMLKDCINTEKPNGFYNEFLKHDLAKHKRVFEAIGSKMAVENVEDQLSGVGFSTTKRNELLVKVIGESERMLKIKI